MLLIQGVLEFSNLDGTPIRQNFDGMVNVEEQVHAWLFAVRAGPGKAAPAKSLALGQHGNSRPLRLYPDVMRQSPMLCTVIH